MIRMQETAKDDLHSKRWEALEASKVPHKKGNKGKTSTEKMMTMSTISMADGYERSKLRSQEARKANTIWDDDDFSQLNNFCAKNLLTEPTKVTRIVRTWMEEYKRDKERIDERDLTVYMSK